MQAVTAEWRGAVPWASGTLLAAEGRPSGTDASLPPLRIVVVEDERLLALEIETYLEQAGHQVVGVADERNIARALAEAERPDLVLLDIRLVRGDSGLDLAADLRTLGLPVLFVTGNCPQDVGRSLALGCLHKPFDERQLVSAVATANRLLRGERIEAGWLPSGLHLYGADR